MVDMTAAVKVVKTAESTVNTMVVKTAESTVKKTVADLVYLTALLMAAWLAASKVVLTAY